VAGPRPGRRIPSRQEVTCAGRGPLRQISLRQISSGGSAVDRLALATAMLLLLLNVFGRGGDMDTRETVTVKGQLHQPYVLRGKCKYLDCVGPGSEKCTGNSRWCGSKKSCPVGVCIAREQSCCCRCAGPNGLLATVETNRLGICGDKRCCCGSQPRKAAEGARPGGRAGGGE
jgi:hypothetical protein